MQKTLSLVLGQQALTVDVQVIYQFDLEHDLVVKNGLYGHLSIDMSTTVYHGLEIRSLNDKKKLLIQQHVFLYNQLL